MPDLKPVFGEELLASQPGYPALIVESESAAEAAKSIVGKAYIVVAWPIGVSVEEVDWSSLVGRKVLDKAAALVVGI